MKLWEGNVFTSVSLQSGRSLSRRGLYGGMRLLTGGIAVEKGLCSKGISKWITVQGGLCQVDSLIAVNLCYFRKIAMHLCKNTTMPYDWLLVVVET